MESDCFVNVEPHFGSDELIGLILSTQKHTLTEEDRRILENRETLQNQLHTLQNAELYTLPDIGHSPHSVLDSSTTSACTTTASDIGHTNIDDFELLLNTAEPNDDFDTNYITDECIIKYITEKDVKDNIFTLKTQIDVNTDKRRSVIDEAKTLFLERKQLMRRLMQVEERLANYSVEEEKIRKMRRKKGQNCAITGSLKHTYFIRFGIPYFKSAYRYPCDSNPELRYLISTDQLFTFKLPYQRRFQSKDMAEFDENVLTQLRTKYIQKLENNLKTLPKPNGKSTNAIDEQRRTIKQEIDRIQKVQSLHDTIGWNIDVDFHALPESPKFDRDDFERFWNLISKPTLSRELFTRDEESKLRKLVEEHGAQNWDRLADLLGTNRSGFICFAKYAMMKLRKKNVRWTAEEDEMLLELCLPLQNMVSKEDRNRSWNVVRSHFPERSWNSLHAHWSYNVNPKWIKGKFTEEEHERVFALSQQGKSYAEISKILRNRSSKQIRSHLEGATMMKTKLGVWTKEEDELLLKAIKMHGTSSWVRIAEEIKTRTRHQCRLRYQWIKNEQDTSRPKSKREYWSREEEAQLEKLLKKYGQKFYLIARHMENRSAKQIRYKCFGKMRQSKNMMEKSRAGSKKK